MKTADNKGSSKSVPPQKGLFTGPSFIIYNLKNNPPAPESIEPDKVSNKFLTVMTDQSGAAACCLPEAK